MFSFTLRRLIGASAVVCLAASAVVVGSVAVPARTLALPGASESTVVTIEPTRVADTRYNVGLTGKITAETPRKFTVTGLIDTYIDSTKTTVVKQVVPAGASGVFLNVTVVNPSEPGFLAIRPGTATGIPATGGLNFGQETVLANSVLVALPATGPTNFDDIRYAVGLDGQATVQTPTQLTGTGSIDIYYGSPTAGASMHVVIDVVGYTTTSGLIALTKRIETLETSGTAGPTGDKGEPGTNGNVGATGNDGATGPAGPNGNDGATGSTGPAGPNGNDGTSCTVADNNDGTATMTCPDGTNATFPIAIDPSSVVGADCVPLVIKQRADLRNCDLTYADLPYADLAGANLTDATLTGATLSAAFLDDAELYGADLTGANLNDANLSYADLAYATLSGAKLYGADLTGATLTEANLTGATLSGATLTYANLTDANLTNANLTIANLTNANLTGANLTNANLTGATLTTGRTGRTSTTLTNVTWSNTTCPDGNKNVGSQPCAV
jgi:uncharacterized protein YjbI with pentapeptide repeats